MIIYIFLDGIGFGENDPEKNPFAKYAKSFFLPLAGKELTTENPFHKGNYLVADASMGVTGLPQSATGQTALWTGFNAPQILGRHVSGYPSFTLKKIINEFSMLKILEQNGKKVSFLNCYSENYIEHLKNNPKHASASSLVQLASSTPFKTFQDLKENKGIYMDITHEVLNEYAEKFQLQDEELLRIRDPFEVGKLLTSIAGEYDLVLYEYFLTDKVGHAMDWNWAKKVIGTVERFLEGVISAIDPNKTQLILSSDHGNLEDLSTKVHTKNPVPVYLYGKHTEIFTPKIKALCDIVPAIYEIFGIDMSFDYEKISNK
ncbi:MAG: metalloenzyme [Leptospiraceae bacterium]|nr:metalloenzyme [Leptospiraceae bacterium]